MKFLIISICAVSAVAADLSQFLPKVPGIPKLTSFPSIPVIPSSSHNDQSKSESQTQTPSLPQIPNFIPPILSTQQDPSKTFNVSALQNFIPTSFPSFPSLPNLIPTQSNPFVTFLQQLLSSFTSNPFQAFRQLDANSFSSAPQSIIRALEAAFENFQKVVNETLSRGIEYVEKSVAQLNATAQSTISNIRNITAQSVSRLDQEIKKYNETIQSCVRDRASAYREIIPEAFNQSLACVNYKVQNGVEIIQEGRDDIAAAVAGASDLSSSLNECSSNYYFGCYISGERKEKDVVSKNKPINPTKFEKKVELYLK